MIIEGWSPIGFDPIPGDPDPKPHDQTLTVDFSTDSDEENITPDTDSTDNNPISAEIQKFSQNIEQQTSQLSSKIDAIPNENTFTNSSSELIPHLNEIENTLTKASRLILMVREFVPLMKQRIVANSSFDINAFEMLVELGVTLENPIDQLKSKIFKKRELLFARAVYLESISDTEVTDLKDGIANLALDPITANDITKRRTELDSLATKIPSLREKILLLLHVEEFVPDGLGGNAAEWKTELVDDSIFKPILDEITRVKAKFDAIEDISTIEQKIRELLHKVKNQSAFEITAQKNELESFFITAEEWFAQLVQNDKTGKNYDDLKDEIYYTFYKVFYETLCLRLADIEENEKAWDDVNQFAVLNRLQVLIEKKAGRGVSSIISYCSQNSIDIYDIDFDLEDLRNKFNSHEGTAISLEDFKRLIHFITVKEDFGTKKALHLTWIAHRAIVVGDAGSSIEYIKGNDNSNIFPKAAGSFIRRGVMDLDLGTISNRNLSRDVHKVSGIETDPATGKLRPKVMKEGDEYGDVVSTNTVNRWFWNWFDKWSRGEKKHVQVKNVNLVNKMEVLVEIALNEFNLAYPNLTKEVNTNIARSALKGWMMYTYHHTVLSNMSLHTPALSYYCSKLSGFTKGYYDAGKLGSDPFAVFWLFGRHDVDYTKEENNPVFGMIGQSARAREKLAKEQGLLGAFSDRLSGVLDAENKYDQALRVMRQEKRGFVYPEGVGSEYIDILLAKDSATLTPEEKIVVERYLETGIDTFDFLFKPLLLNDEHPNDVFTMVTLLTGVYLTDENGKSLRFQNEIDGQVIPGRPISPYEVRTAAISKEIQVGVDEHGDPIYQTVYEDTGDVLYDVFLAHEPDLGSRLIDLSNNYAVNGAAFLELLRSKTFVDTLNRFTAGNINKLIGYVLPLLPDKGRIVGAELHIGVGPNDPNYKLKDALTKKIILICIMSILCRQILTSEDNANTSPVKKAVQTLTRLAEDRVITPDEAFAIQCALKGAFTGYSILAHISDAFANQVNSTLKFK